MNGWIIFGLIVLTYITGYTLALAHQLRTCKYRADGHTYRDSYYNRKHSCSHEGDFETVMWPIVALFYVVAAPFWLVSGGALKIATKLAEYPTREERAEIRAKKELQAKQERDIERKQLKERVHQLEDELGYPRSVFHAVKEKKLA